MDFRFTETKFFLSSLEITIFHGPVGSFENDQTEYYVFRSQGTQFRVGLYPLQHQNALGSLWIILGTSSTMIEKHRCLCLGTLN